MSRSTVLPRSRPGAALVAGAVLLASAIAGAGSASAQATASVADNLATVLRIGGAAVSGATSIPAGRTLTPVQLVTSDPVTSSTPTTAVGDGTILSGAVPEVRSPRFVLPAVPAEAATFRINGATVATTVPDMRATWLETDGGQVPGVLFTAGGTSYVIPRGSIGAVTRTVAPSTVNTPTVSNLITYQYALLPVGAQPRTGTTFEQNTFGTTVTSSGTATHTVYDADAIRGNADALAEELVLIGRPPTTSNTSRLATPGTEVLATVTLRGGATLTVRGLRYQSNFNYGSAVTTWAFDRAALADAAATIADVTDVVSFATADHSLTWQDLGFDLI